MGKDEQHNIKVRIQQENGRLQDDEIVDEDLKTWFTVCMRAIKMALEVLSVAHAIKGVACPKCKGSGQYYYPNTATWRDGPGVISGRAFTWDTCDECWGTGRTDKKGVNLRTVNIIVE